LEIDVYERFRERFSVDSSDKAVRVDRSVESGEAHLRELFAQFGGDSFNDGLYRVMDAGASDSWSKLVGQAFPTFSGAVTCFGFDWLGRIFALDARRLVEGLPGVVMLEPGTGQALEIPCNVHNFHESELIEYREEALAASFFQKWISIGGDAPKVAECIGYKKPLFLGGKDTVENLERSDMDVYWTIATQLIEKARGLPAGTRIGSVRID
jgi:hypothetical protein